MIEYLCPVCRRVVDSTPSNCIHGHCDKALNHCPGAFQPFYIALRTETAFAKSKNRRFWRPNPATRPIY